MASIRRRTVAAAATVIAAIMVTTTACEGKKDDGAASKPSATAGADQAGESGGDGGAGGIKLPKGVPTSLNIKDLQKWKNGGWKDYGHWASKAEDFANPYIKDFWTPERIAQAKESLPGITVAGNRSSGSSGRVGAYTPDGQVKRYRAKRVAATYHHYAPPVGKLFFTTPQGASVCSAAVVNDPAHPGKSNMVWTAGHCVHAGAEGGWYRNIAFIPSFNNSGRLNSRQAAQNYRSPSVSPYGLFWVDWATTSAQWIRGGAGHKGTWASTYDYAVLHVKPESGQKSLQERVGSALPVWFGAPAANKVKNMKVRGYPAEAPYEGSKMYDCHGATKRFVLGTSYPSQYPSEYMVGCTMTGGASGGPWFMDHNGRNYLVSNTSLGDRDRYLTGPRLGSNAHAVYMATSNKFKHSR
ncbi:trypsin-like serine peptidase [Streptomyces sp. NPDC002004]